MSTRSKSRESSLGHVLQCDIEENLTATVTIRKYNRWFYLSVEPDQIKNDHLRGQYERRADAARQQHEAYQDFCNGASEGNDSGYASDDESDEVFKEWIQQPLKEVFEKHAQDSKKDSLSVEDWYQTDIDCYSIVATAKDDDLQLKLRNDLDGKAFLRDSVIPSMAIPKYIRENEDVDWYSPSEITVLEEEHNIHMPIHPTLVSVNGKECFLKLVSKEQEPAVKREIRFLLDFQNKDLYNQGLRAPKLEGLVTLPNSPESHMHILGFLLSLIPQPCTPLTKLMTSEIPASKRNKWASGVEKQTSLLHNHDLLWGDAKADNFLVDREDQLWIIDFGGSFTIGWIEPDMYGTKKGENKAVKLIIDGLKDPDCKEVDGLIGETDDKTPSQTDEAKAIKAATEKKESNNSKRKRDVDEEDDNDTATASDVEEKDGKAAKKMKSTQD